MTDLLVTVQVRFPTVDRQVVADHIAPLMNAAVAAGGEHTTISVQPYDDDENGQE